MLTLYDDAISGNGYKARLLLHQLDRPYELIELDILKAETRTPEFLAINPNGRIPTLKLDDGRCLSESNAILFYLAEGSAYLPSDPFERAKALQWMFFEQYSHEPFIATSRFLRLHREQTPDVLVDLERRRSSGEAALEVMQQHLETHEFFVANSYSIADIALFAYTQVAGEGGFDVAPYPAIVAWLDRVRAQPRFVAMG